MDEKHTIAEIRYIERNPVRARMVKQAWNYQWSSAKYRLGLTKHDPLMNERDQLGLNLEWSALLQSDPAEIDSLRKNTSSGRVCGNNNFAKFLERKIGRKLLPSKPGRSRKNQ